MSRLQTSAPQAGRRERKKAATRDLITDTALELFLERGFDHVTVTDIADAADVSPQTVFNHFPTKEDLVFARLEHFEAQLLAGVREREAGEGVISAFRRQLLARHGLLAQNDAESRNRLVKISRMIQDSVTLRQREDRVFATHTDDLATLLEDGQSGGIGPWVIANSLVGVHRAIVLATRRGILNGVPSRQLAKSALEQCSSALDMLERGLAQHPSR